MFKLQVWDGEKWVDLMIRLNLKEATEYKAEYDSQFCDGFRIVGKR